MFVYLVHSGTSNGRNTPTEREEMSAERVRKTNVVGGQCPAHFIRQYQCLPVKCSWNGTNKNNLEEPAKWYVINDWIHTPNSGIVETRIMVGYCYKGYMIRSVHSLFERGQIVDFGFVKKFWMGKTKIIKLNGWQVVGADDRIQ